MIKQNVEVDGERNRQRNIIHLCTIYNITFLCYYCRLGAILTNEKMEMSEAKEGELNGNTVPNLGPSANHLKSSAKGRKRKRRKQKQEIIGSKIKNDNDILVENDGLVHRTDSVPSTASGSYTNPEVNEIAGRTGDIRDKDKKSTFPEDVRKVALTLAVSNMMKPKVKENLATLDHIDYVLVYSDDDKHSQISNEALNELRNKFEKKVELEGLSIVRKKKGNSTFVVMSCSFERLCKEAEAVSLKMPLAGVGYALA